MSQIKRVITIIVHSDGTAAVPCDVHGEGGSFGGGRSPLHEVLYFLARFDLGERERLVAFALAELSQYEQQEGDIDALLARLGEEAEEVYRKRFKPSPDDEEYFE